MPPGRRHRPTVAIADVGSTAAFHIGDEAMLDALMNASGDRGWIVVSLDPEGTRRRLDVPAVRRLGFDAADTPMQRETRLTEVLGFDHGRPAPTGDPAGAVLAALDGAGGLLLAGGGNLSSTWPEHVYERVALIALARRRGLPIVVSGQTVGPQLFGREREILGWALRQAALVGVREPDSRRLALQLGVEQGRIALALDDAMFLAGADREEPTEPFIAVTLCELGTPSIEAPLLRGLARDLAAISRHADVPLVLVPHLGALDGALSGDVRVSATMLKLLLELGVRATCAELLAPAEVAALTRRAEMVVATRYHPLVFGLSGAVPSLALTLDEYTRTKMCGALGFAGLEGWSLPVEDAASGLLAEAAIELWSRRAEVSAHVEALLSTWRQSATAHVARVLGALDSDTRPGQEPQRPATAPTPTGDWAIAARAATGARESAERPRRELEATVFELHRKFAEAERYALSLRAHLDEAERYALSLRAALDERTQDGGAQPRQSRRSTTARSAPRELVISDLRHQQSGLDAHASMLVQHDGADLGRLVLRRHVADLAEIDGSGTPFAAPAVLLAGALGADLRIDALIDELAEENANKAAALLSNWFHWPTPAIRTAGPTEPRAPATQTGLFFSRGLDSMATLVTERERIDVLIGMDWRDPPYATVGSAQVWDGTQRAAGEAGLHLIGLSTNARTLLDPFVPWELSHGAVLAALGLLASPSVGEMRMSGSHLAGREEPHGSHQDLVPLWTSSRLAVTYAAGPGSRHAKAAAIADDPLAMKWLKVCWQRDGEGNCGRCTKCLKTMTNFAIAGRLDAARGRFDGPLTADAVLAAAGSGATTPANVLSILDELDPADPLYEPWKLVYARAVERDPLQTGPGS